MPPKVATQAITVPINEYSDGDVSHRPVQPPYTPCEPDLYLGKLAKKWMGDTGMAEQGRSYVLDRLPAGYVLFDKPRASGHRDKYLFGHPSHQFFDSPNKFYPHFRYLMEHGQTDHCDCDACKSPAAQLPRAGPGVRSSKGKGRMKEIDVGPVDEEGTPDLYSAMMQELFRVRKLDTTFDEPRSMDWRVERTMLPIMVDKIHKQPSFIPRVGELVLWCRDLDGEIAYDPWMKEFKMHDPKTEKYTGYPQWMCGTVAQVPNEEVQIEDLVTETKKQNAINVSGFRVECLPDPNDYTKGYSKQYSYVPLHHIRPLNFWQEILHGIPEGDWHPSIFHGLSVMASMCVVKPFRFAGTWPSCNVFCKAMFVGAELFFVGDTVRLIPAQSQAKITDVLHIEKIFVKWANLEVNADGVVDESSASNLGLHLLGHAYTSDEKRSYKGMTLERDEDTGKYPLGMEGYDRWYYMQRPDSLHDYTYDRILGRCFEAEAMMLWSAKEEPTLDFGLQGTRAARLYSAENDQRLVTSEKKWFWGEHRADCLDLGTLNGIEIGSRDSDRDPKSWRDTLRVIDGETSQKEVEARTPKSTEGRSSKSTFTPINSQSSLVGSALQQVDDSDETSDEHHDSLKEELENEPFGNDDDMITDDEVIKQAKEASHIQGKGPDQSEEDEVAKSVTEEHGRNELGSPESNRKLALRRN